MLWTGNRLFVAPRLTGTLLVGNEPFRQHRKACVRLYYGVGAPLTPLVDGEIRVEQQAEQRLLSRIRRGDRDACEEFVRDYHRPVYSLLAHLCRDTHLAEDLTQETFASAWSELGGFAGRSTLRTWLHRIAYRKFVDATRRSRCRTEKTEEFQRQYTSPMQDDAAERLIVEERHRLLYDAVGEMDEADRLMVTLHYFQDMSYSDMAAVLDKPTGTVKWQTSQALQRLRTRLNGRMGS
jgi:RNA polymerase sigma-70 factor, ECF subfamily